MTAQVSLFLYHVSPNENIRNNMPGTGTPHHPNLSDAPYQLSYTILARNVIMD